MSKKGRTSVAMAEGVGNQNFEAGLSGQPCGDQ